MASNENIQAPGVLLAGAIIVGTVGGVIVGEPSIGFLVGAAAGLIVLGLYWLKGRKQP
jgi:mannose/fructose/N-acetylgalactosamine-specific phosphotransferase system component IIC